MASTPASSSSSVDDTTRPSSPGPAMADDQKDATMDEAEKQADGQGLDPGFGDVSLDGLTGREKREAKEKLAKLNYLLKASGIYSKIIADNIARSRKQREEADAKAEKKAEQAALAAASAPAEEGQQPARHSDRNAARAPEAAPTTNSRKRRTRGDRTAKDEASKEAAATEKSDILREEIDAPLEGQPKLLTGAKMRGYQLAGMHWLATLYEQGLNGILADEMGLGKTLQTIAFLCYLRERAIWGPFLVVCPLSTVANWVNEFERFCPDFPVVLYHGSVSEREEIRQTRLGPPSDAKGAFLGPSAVRGKGGAGAKGGMGGKNLRAAAPNTTKTFPVVVTSYELVMNDRKWLGQYAWRFIVVDESHRLKNLECKLVQELKSYTSANRLLLTGTPLHNNLKELWSLLNFILPEVFDDYSSFEQWFDLSNVTAADSASSSAAALSDAQTQHIVSNLHAILKPFLLRRMKSDVETSLPKKKEYLLSAPLTAQQKELYDAVINRSLRQLLLQKQDSAATSRNASAANSALPSDVDDDEDADDPLPASKRRRSTRASAVSSRKPSEDGESSSSSSSSEDEGEAPLAATSRRSHVQRKNARRDYAERTDAQFFREADAGTSAEITDLFGGDMSRTASSVGDDGEGGGGQKRRKGWVQQLKLQNVVMSLRKVCNHPWLFDWPVDPASGEYVINEGLVAASGKMLLLERLLEALFEKGHKVLLFSQFTSMLDIIQDWANELKGWDTCRIDGATKQQDRRDQMKSFNDPTGCDLFLLSTRAGGVGINLVAADTVILFDSDWNPQQDLQAQDRAHRIGQTKPVLVFRFVSGNTIESKILQRASEKRKLEALVIGQGFAIPGAADIFSGAGGAKKGQAGGGQGSMVELAEKLLRTDGEKIALAEKGDRILDDAQLASLLDRSDEAMSRSLGWQAKSLVDGGGAVMEVYETKPSAESDPVDDVLSTSNPVAD